MMPCFIYVYFELVYDKLIRCAEIAALRLQAETAAKKLCFHGKFRLPAKLLELAAKFVSKKLCCIGFSVFVGDDL